MGLGILTGHPYAALAVPTNTISIRLVSMAVVIDGVTYPVGYGWPFVIQTTQAFVTGGVVEIANAVRMMGDVRDAMRFVHGETSGVVVWRDGDCPCSYCSSRGTTQGRTCERCNGVGRR